MNNHHSQIFTSSVSALHRVLSDPRALLQVLVIVMVIFLGFVIVLLLFPNIRKETGTMGPAILSACVVAVGWIAKKAVDDSQNARTLALALVSDVTAIMTAIEKVGIAQDFISTFDNPRDRFLWADVGRNEYYFSVFDANVGKLGALREPKMAAAITTFYTFLKVSRDATSPLLIKGDDRASEKPQAAKAAEKEPEESGVENSLIERKRRVRMILVILETTFNAGIRVIDTYKEIYEFQKAAGCTPEEVRKSAEKTLEAINNFLSQTGRL